MRCYWSIGHVMLFINLWCIRCMIRFYHACNLYIQSNPTVCFYQWCIQCMLAMLLSVDSFKVLRDVVLRDVVLRDAWFTCYSSTLLTLYFIDLRYIPLIYAACSTCHQYTMILIKLGLHVTTMRLLLQTLQPIINEWWLFVMKILEVVCQWTEVQTPPAPLCIRFTAYNR